MQQRTALGLSIVVLSLVIAGLHFTANMYYLYWAWWWFDILMHFLGGLFIGLSALWWLRFEVPISIRRFFPKFLTTFTVVLIVGIVWEVFEYVVGAYGASNYVLDTTLDLVMDIAGMLAAYLVFLRYGK